MAVVVAVGKVERRDRPGAREIHQLAISADQAERLGLRQILQPVDEKMMGVLAGHQPLELLRRLDIGGERSVARLLHDQIDRLQSPRGLLRENDSEIGGVPLIVRDRITAQIPGSDHGGGRYDDDERHTDKG